MNLEQIPRRGYVQIPTPLQELRNFSRVLGDKVRVYIKRDDLLPGCVGGNETRGLDFCIAEAVGRGANALITCGAVQSNHCRLTLAWALKEGMECHLVLEERIKGSYRHEATGNNFLFQLLDVPSVTIVPSGVSLAREMEHLSIRLQERGLTPYIVPDGAASPLGMMGYILCAREILAQSAQLGIMFHSLILPSSSGGTQAGLLLGLHEVGLKTQVLGINVSRSRDVQEKLVAALARSAGAFAAVAEEIPPSSVICFGEYVGPGYALPTDGMVEAVRTLARTEGILLDPVYSGKAMAGLIGLVRKNYFPVGSDLLFLHTGGSPVLYAYRDIFL
jgi:D-cysteine desulfhydrase